MNPLLLEVALLLVVAIAAALGVHQVAETLPHTLALRGILVDPAALSSAVHGALAWFDGGIALVIVARVVSGRRFGARHIPTPLLLPAAYAAAALGLVTQVGYVMPWVLGNPGVPFLERWNGETFAQGVFAGSVIVAGILAFGGDIGARVTQYRRTLAVGIVVLLTALLVAPKTNGAHVNLGPVQPMEAIKVAGALVLGDFLGGRATQLRYHKEKLWGVLPLPQPRHFVPALGVLAAAFLILLVLNDLGPTLIFGLLFLGAFAVVTRAPGWPVAAFAFVGSLLAFLVQNPDYAPGAVATRLRMWTDPWTNLLPNGVQLAQALWALAAGGWSGAGLGAAFPGGVAEGHTDLVYAHLVEELGTLGGLAYLACLGVIVASAGVVAVRNRTAERQLLTMSLALLLVAQVTVILCGTLGLLPLTGVVVPFLSYGKSSMAAFLGVSALLVKLADDGERRARLDTLDEVGLGARSVTLAALGVLLALGGATVWRATFHRDETTLHPVVQILREGGVNLGYDRRLTSIAARIRRGSVLDRGGNVLAATPLEELPAGSVLAAAPGARVAPLGAALGTVLGFARGDLRPAWSLETQHDARLRGWPDAIPEARARAGVPAAVWMQRRSATSKGESDPPDRALVVEGLALPGGVPVDAGTQARARATMERDGTNVACAGVVTELRAKLDRAGGTPDADRSTLLTQLVTAATCAGDADAAVRAATDLAQLTRVAGVKRSRVEELAEREDLRALRARAERAVYRVPLDAMNFHATEEGAIDILGLSRLALEERMAALTAVNTPEAVATRSVTLTLDARVQKDAADTAKRIAQRASQVGAAAVVVLEADTGRVVARAQWPDFDPSEANGSKFRADHVASTQATYALGRKGNDEASKRVRAEAQARWGKVLGGTADPRRFAGIYGAWNDKTGIGGRWMAGSVFKLVSSVLAVREGRVTPAPLTEGATCAISADPRFRCDSSLQLEGWTRPIKNHGDGSGAGEVDLVAALAKSSNVYFGQLALALGPAPYRALLEQLRAPEGAWLGFGEATLPRQEDGDYTGLGAPGSRRLAETGFGQGAALWSVTEAARFTAAIANGGTYHDCGAGYLLADRACTSTRIVDDPASLAPLLAGMRGVMQAGGTAGRVAGRDVAGVRLYGKTGTAQAPGNRDEAPWGIKKDGAAADHAWFVAIAEASGDGEACDTNHVGRYVVAAVVPHGGFGADAAAPLALEVVRSLRGYGYLGEAARLAGTTEKRATTRSAGR